MDPDACLDRILDVVGDPDDILEAVRDLIEWLDKGGHVPVNRWNHAYWDLVLEAYDKAAGNHGIEACRAYTQFEDPYYMDIGMLYSNTGDSYAETLCFDTAACRFRLCGWAEMVEALEAKGTVFA